MIPRFEHYMGTRPMYQMIEYMGVPLIPIQIPVYAYTTWGGGIYTWNHILKHILYTSNRWEVTNSDDTSRILEQKSADGTVVWRTKQVIDTGDKDHLVVDEYNMMVDPPTHMARIHYTTKPPNIIAEWSRELHDLFE